MKRFRGREVLRGVSISVERGECYGLAGPNGAGKTTLIRLLLGLALPSAGEVRLLGHRPDDPEARRRVGFVPEAAELPPSASPRALVRRFSLLRGLEPRAAQRRGLEQLERMGLAELLDRPCGKLSKGEKQRTLLALALLSSPELLVLDEPTDGLDPIGRALVRRVLREEQAQGRTIFLNSHLLSETERVCTRVGILHKGELVREHAIAGRGAGPAERNGGGALASAEQGASVVVLASGRTETVEHADAAALNAALDRLRARGELLVELHPMRVDLEASFEAAVSGPRLPPTEPPVLAALQQPQLRPARAAVAALRVAREIVLDLAARKVGWMALAFALLLLGTFLWSLRGDLLQGAAAAFRRFGGPGGAVDDATAARFIGRWAGTTLYGVGLFFSVLVASVFAPPVLDPRRTVLLLAEPIDRGDLACGLFAAVCALQLAAGTFFAALLFFALRYLGIPVGPGMLLAPLPLALAFAALYAVVLGATWLVRSAVFAAAVGYAAFAACWTLGTSDAAQPGAAFDAASVAYGLLPRLAALAQQAGRLGAGERLSAQPFVATAAFAAASLLLLCVAARRSER